MKRFFVFLFATILLLAFHFICGMQNNTATLWDYGMLSIGYIGLICAGWRNLQKNM